ncbi:MAG: hypothetical protein ACJA2W_000376 [Planctomycetota bacterium]|jgi:hypothetical protein
MTASAEPQPARLDGSQETVERVFTDRRQQPTPMLSRYWLRGRRRQAGRRAADVQHVYVDRYTRGEIALLLWLTSASLADLGLTLLHIHQGGGEANPIMGWFLVQGGTAAFAAAKLGLTAIPALFLLFHARFRGTRVALFGLAGMYAVLLAYHAFAAWNRLAS